MNVFSVARIADQVFSDTLFRHHSISCKRIAVAWFDSMDYWHGMTDFPMNQKLSTKHIAKKDPHDEGDQIFV
jgi:uncharacterized protein YozE (UPF0346 family)